jgi:hypothetical protein
LKLPEKIWLAFRASIYPDKPVCWTPAEKPGEQGSKPDPSPHCFWPDKDERDQDQTHDDADNPVGISNIGCHANLLRFSGLAGCKGIGTVVAKAP